MYTGKTLVTEICIINKHKKDDRKEWKTKLYMHMKVKRC